MHTQLITLLKQMNKLEVIYLAQDEKRSKRGVKIDQVSVASNKKHYFLEHLIGVSKLIICLR